MDCTVHGISQARILEWVAFPFSRESPQPRSPILQADSLPAEPQDPASSPGSGRSAGEEIDYPLQYYWASLIAQLVKNMPAMQEIVVRFLGQEDPLEKGLATYSSILGLPWWLRW